MHLSIHYTTSFSYAEPVRLSHNELRAAPTSDLFQRLLSYRVSTTPAARTFPYLDYFGTLVDSFGIHLPHTDLAVDVEAVVETSTQTRVLAPGVPFTALDDPRFRDANYEYLIPSSHVDWADGVAGLADRARDGADDLAHLVARYCDELAADVVYETGASEVGDHVEDLLAQGRGVCQDYAHILIALCRSTGIPARYVSGYLFASADDTGLVDDSTDLVEVQTHAWAEVLLPGHDWVPIDPTNRLPVLERHVKIGHGRDYGDVAPLRGVYVGGGEPRLTAQVRMRRVDRPDRAAPLYQQRQALEMMQQQQQQ